MIIATTFGTRTLYQKGLSLFNFSRFSPHGPEGKVGVHQGVDKVVHGHEPSGAGGELAEAVEDIDEHRQVVIPATQYIQFVTS